jgi:hypothetical protein
LKGSHANWFEKLAVYVENKTTQKLGLCSALFQNSGCKVILTASFVLRAHISGRQTPGFNPGFTLRICYIKPGVHPPHLLNKRGVNPGLNPEFGFMTFGLFAQNFCPLATLDLSILWAVYNNKNLQPTVGRAVCIYCILYCAGILSRLKPRLTQVNLGYPRFT